MVKASLVVFAPDEQRAIRELPRNMPAPRPALGLAELPCFDRTPDDLETFDEGDIVVV